jgi:hypothetical protein
MISTDAIRGMSMSGANGALSLLNLPMRRARRTDTAPPEIKFSPRLAACCGGGGEAFFAGIDVENDNAVPWASVANAGFIHPAAAGL